MDQGAFHDTPSSPPNDGVELDRTGLTRQAPDGDPRGTAADGALVGADVRCVVNDDGTPTRQPFWDPTSGPFADNPQNIVTRLLNGAPPPECP